MDAYLLINKKTGKVTKTDYIDQWMKDEVLDDKLHIVHVASVNDELLTVEIIGERGWNDGGTWKVVDTDGL